MIYKGTYLLRAFDEMRKQIKTDKEGKEILKQFRKKLKRSENLSYKYAEYFDCSLNSGEMSDRLAKDMRLL